MKILSWNVRGLGGVAKRLEVRKLIAGKKSFHCLFTRNEDVCF